MRCSTSEGSLHYLHDDKGRQLVTPGMGCLTADVVVRLTLQWCNNDHHLPYAVAPWLYPIVHREVTKHPIVA